MANNELNPMWGVVGLNEAEQRQVRGGQHWTRARCIRQAQATYVSRIRSGVSRASARQSLLNDLAQCNSYGSSN